MIFPPSKQPSQPSQPSSRPWPFRAGTGARLTSNSLGDSILAVPEGKTWRHPWFTRLHWAPSQRRWVVTVRPGFVNGICPVVVSTVAEAAADAQADFGINPITGKPYFSDPIFAKPGEKLAGTAPVKIPLYMRPAIAPAWRNLGWDGPADGNAIPDFFASRGVHRAPANGGLSLDGEPVNRDATTRPAGNRLLRAADLILHQPRLALTSQILLEPGILTGISNVTQILGIRSPAPGDALKVFSGTMADPRATAIDPLAGDYEEPNFDEIKIATVYLLSPPDAVPHSEPDASWQPFVRHDLFWNLCHVTPPFEITAADLTNAFASLTKLATVLGGGTAALGVNFTAAGLNDLARQALNMITGHSMAGAFYTATSGGGSASVPAAESMPSGSPAAGLDKDARLAAKRAEAAAARRKAKLDPAYPFRGISFPVSYFN